MKPIKIKLQKLILPSMKRSVKFEVSTHVLYTCLFVVIALLADVVASQIQQIKVKPIKNKRLNVPARDVIARSSPIKCESTCRQTSWCTSANMAPDRSTCHLLSEEVSTVTSLEPAEGWTYLREYQ